MEEDTHMPDPTPSPTDPENPTGAWYAVQHRFWRNWTRMASAKGPWPMNDFYQDWLTVLEDATDCALDTQAQWNRVCLKSLHPAEATLPPAWEDSCQRLETLADTWVGAKRAAVKSWFDAARHQRPVNWAEPADKAWTLYATWIDTQRELLHGEQAWLQHLMHDDGAQAQPEAVEKPGAPAPPATKGTRDHRRTRAA